MTLEDYSIKNILLGLIGLLNVLSYFLYYSDKKKARKRQRRISEKTLLFATFFFGGLGAWLGMKQFRHKTKQITFRIAVPLAALLTLGAIYAVLQYIP